MLSDLSFHSFKACFCIGRKFMKLNQLFTRMIAAMRTILQIFFATAFSNLTSLTISDQLSSLGLASVTIDVFSLELESKLLGIKVSRFLSGNIVVISGSQKRGTVGTDKTAVRNHF
jgi:hypothetical protein